MVCLTLHNTSHWPLDWCRSVLRPGGPWARPCPPQGSKLGICPDSLNCEAPPYLLAKYSHRQFASVALAPLAVVYCLRLAVGKEFTPNRV